MEREIDKWDRLPDDGSFPEVVAHCIVCGGWIDELMMEDNDPSAPCCSTECAEKKRLLDNI